MLRAPSRTVWVLFDGCFGTNSVEGFDKGYERGYRAGQFLGGLFLALLNKMFRTTGDEKEGELAGDEEEGGLAGDRGAADDDAAS